MGWMQLQKKEVLLFRWEMFVVNYSLPGKNNCNRTQVKWKCLLWSCRKVVQRFCNHTKSFTHEDYTNDTELSKEYWEIERKNFIPKVTWSIVREFPLYNLSKKMLLVSE